MAARVDANILRRSSISALILSPYFWPVDLKNCQNPMAPFEDPTCGLNALSAIATYFRSSGISFSLRIFSIMGRYRVVRFIHRTTCGRSQMVSNNSFSRRSRTSWLPRGTDSPQKSIGSVIFTLAISEGQAEGDGIPSSCPAAIPVPASMIKRDVKKVRFIFALKCICGAYRRI